MVKLPTTGVAPGEAVTGVVVITTVSVPGVAEAVAVGVTVAVTEPVGPGVGVGTEGVGVGVRVDAGVGVRVGAGVGVGIGVGVGGVQGCSATICAVIAPLSFAVAARPVIVPVALSTSAPSASACAPLSNW